MPVLMLTLDDSPKLFLHVFIGSRLAKIVEEGSHMTGRDRAINYGGMVVGSVVGIVVGWLIYRRTMARAAEIAAEEGGLDRSATTAGGQNAESGYFDDNDERGPLMMIDPDDAAALMDDDDISLWAREDEDEDTQRYVDGDDPEVIPGGSKPKGKKVDLDEEAAIEGDGAPAAKK
jgi:hypothetical protein